METNGVGLIEREKEKTANTDIFLSSELLSIFWLYNNSKKWHIIFFNISLKITKIIIPQGKHLAPCFYQYSGNINRP